MLNIEQVEAAYGKIPVLRQLSLSVKAGSITVVLGANGSGKTTLMRCVAGLLRPRRGRVLFRGQEIHRLKSHQIARLGFALVPEGRGILGSLTVRENLELALFKYRATERPRGLRLIGQLYERFPILHQRANQSAGTLSGGEQQMLAIARSLVMAPEMVALDEPSLGLAPLVVSLIFDLISEMHSEGRTVLLVEQRISQALAIADYVYVLKLGQVVAHGEPALLLRDDTVRRTYLGGTEK